MDVSSLGFYLLTVDLVNPTVFVLQIAVELAQASPGGQQVAALMSSGYERIHQMMAQVSASSVSGTLLRPTPCLPAS